MAKEYARRSFLIGAGGVTATPLLEAAAHAGKAAPDQDLWQSEIVRFHPQGHLIYEEDDERNRVPDFSYAGYRNGGQTIPNVPTVLTIGPIEGDNTSHIQAAVDQVGKLPPDTDGIRGAVLLRAGVYPVAGTIRVGLSGVVLRGEGNGSDPSDNTIIHGVGNTPQNRTIVTLGGAGRDNQWSEEVPGTRTDVLTGFVPVGARRFVVADPRPLRPGDPIVIVHPNTEDWLEAIDYGGTDTAPPWTPQTTIPIVYNRYVQEVRGRQVTIDVPVFNHLQRGLSQSYLYRRDNEHLVTQSGIESLRIDIEFHGDPDEDEDHARNAIVVTRAEDVWVRGCTLLHFIFAGVATVEATRVTVADCRALDPVSFISGGRRYNFAAAADSQQILFTDCVASNARHAFVANGRSADSGLVFLRCVSVRSRAMSEAHRQWGQALLYDNHREIDPLSPTERTLGLCNHGSWGWPSAVGTAAHGWAAAHSVAWNCDTSDTALIVQKPPTAQNYAIGCHGDVTGDGPFLTGPSAHGYIEGANRPGIFPVSLYEAQLADRFGD